MRAKSQNGFTLIELLVVISVLVVLAVFLIPQIGTIRERARRSSCLENLRVIGVGLHTFAADNSGTFPTANTAVAAFDSIFVAGNVEDIGAFDCPSGTVVAAGALGNLTASDYVYSNTDLDDQDTQTSVIVSDSDTNHTLAPAVWNFVQVSGTVAQATNDVLGADND